MQDEHGLKTVLSDPRLYTFFQNAVGAKKARRWMAGNVWKPSGHEKIVDIGCGPGVCLDYFPPGVSYIGFDMNREYIEAARKKYGEKGVFLLGSIDDFIRKPDARMAEADLVLSNGLMHHLDDREAVDMLRFAKGLLKPKGRLVCLENAYLIHQGCVSRWILRQDRGKNVRDEWEWKALVGRVFGHFSTAIATGLLRIPYVHIIIECSQDPAEAVR